MGAPSSGIKAAGLQAAESLSGSFKAIDAAELNKHQAVLDYWVSIRGDREYPALHDLDPLQISEAGPSSLLLELISGGEDAEIRHCGEAIKGQMDVERIADAPRASIAACVAKKLSLVAISRNFLAFEDQFTTDGATTRCWVTLLPLSAAGAWVDYVYALISFDTVEADAGGPVQEPEVATEDLAGPAQVEETAEPAQVEEIAEPAQMEDAVEPADVQPEMVEEEPPITAAEAAEPQEELEHFEEAVEVSAPKSVAGSGKAGPGFSKLLEDLANLGGFYKSHAEKAGLTFPSEPAAGEEPLEIKTEAQAVEPDSVESAEEPAPAAEVEEQAAVEKPVEPMAAEQMDEPTVVDEQPVDAAAPEEIETPAPVMEGTLQTKLADVRAKADEARMAKLKANLALYEGLSAAYDFALDAEDAPEEYLKLVEAQGLKIQLRSPMKPVVKLAFNGLCDDSTISQLEAVLAWALEQELPRGSLAGRIEEVGGISPILSGQAQAA